MRDGNLPVTVSINDVPEVAAAASRRFRDELLAILGADLVGAWLHGGTTFTDRRTGGDIDIGVAIAGLTASERAPRRWSADPTSRPSRIHVAQAAIARDLGVELDVLYLPAEEVGRSRLPSAAFQRTRRESGWAVYRAHWLAGQYVPLHGTPPDELVVPPTPAEIRRALDRELEHIERHVLEGDAQVPYEASYAIWNGCRILFTLETGSAVISKRAAGAWGLEHLPERWHDALHAAGRWGAGTATAADTERLREAMGPFVEMVRRRLPAARRKPGPPRWS